ncbi:unnamed protein product [Medioppia subpectinata]|uniref:Histone-lysine N-methyltransferase n=1 Tax=Medioppia subpectinata TaxID=1979941 RepID=A0A7R9KL88_9ACAR|nr:unnamed protein product [Medioppia subpectinata]CAG2104446.1 unnamed protein product [Medioppia subpectinata]
MDRVVVEDEEGVGRAAGDTSLVTDDSGERVAEHPLNSAPPTAETLVSNANQRVVYIDLDMDSEDEMCEYFDNSCRVSRVEALKEEEELEIWSWDEFDAFTRNLQKVVSQEFDHLAVLYRMSGRKHTVAELRANQKLVVKLKTEIEVEVGNFFDQKFEPRNNSERLRAIEAVKDVAKRLKLEDNGFPTLTDWFEFIDRRPEVADRLARFNDTCNKVIAKKREGLEISVANDYDLEVPELEQYVGECVYDRKLYPKLTATDAEKYTIHFEEEEDELTIVYDSLAEKITNLRITSNEWRDTTDTNIINSKSKSNVWPNKSQPIEPISDAINTSTTSRRAESVNNADKKCVEEIRDHRIDLSGHIEYLLKWKDCPEKENTWKLGTHVTDCQELLQRFRSETVNGRYPAKWSWDELDAFTRYLKEVVSPEFDDLAVLYRLWDHKHTVAELRANQKLVIDLKTEIEGKVRNFFTLKFESKTNLERYRAMGEINVVAKQLRLRDNGFETLTKWFEFIDQRSDVAKGLARLAHTWNKVIREKGEGVEISVANDYDLEVPVLKRYVGKCMYDKKLYPKLTPTDTEKYTIHSCECQDCFQDKKKCCPARNKSSMVYDGKDLLRKNILNKSTNTMIFECNDKCKCGPDCANRVIQRGRVGALERIPSGAFVSNYSGEVILSTEADKRPNIYLFDAIWPKRRWFGTVDDRANEYVIDAYKCGNVSRFINHSCEPNCRALYSYVRSYNKHFPTVSLFTTRAIEPYEELTYDYGNAFTTAPKNWTEEANSNGNGVSTGVANGESRPAADRPERLALKRIPCHCSTICRKSLYLKTFI